jgi:hypothetical protein
VTKIGTSNSDRTISLRLQCGVKKHMSVSENEEFFQRNNMLIVHIIMLQGNENSSHFSRISTSFRHEKSETIPQLLTLLL